MSVTIPLRWEGDALPYHVDTVETAHRQYDFIAQSIRRLDAPSKTAQPLAQAVLAPLATGGAMAVYKLTAEDVQGESRHLVCKIPHQRRIVYTSGTRSDTPLETTQQLLDRLAELAHQLHHQAPGLFPRSGGVWHWRTVDGGTRHLLVEEFIPGLSVERLRHACEQQWTAGGLSESAYRQQRLQLDRLAIATFIRLWDALGRRTFTSDPSPWNLLVHPQLSEEMPPTATIIDLHSLEEEVGLSYVIQRLTALYGLRQDVIEEALLPGVLDALGPDEGRSLLHAELPRLEAEAEQATKNLGVDLQQPLLKAIRAL
jgi:hypothetical protein